MCRLFGIAGPGIQQADINAFVDMGIAAQVQGKDAAGIFQTNTRCAPRHNVHEDGYKTCGNFMELLDDLDTYSYAKPRVHPHLLNTVMIDVLMGHVRARTRGKNIMSNAHPFYTKSMVGMHNGTLNDPRFAHAEKTDSEMMFLEMEYRGILPVLDNMDSKNAYAISVYNRDTRTLAFATNGQRPLWFASLKDRDVIYWASEPAILRFAMDRRGIAYYKPYPLPVGILARLTPSAISKKDTVQGWTKIADIKEKPLPERILDAIKTFENTPLPMLEPPKKEEPVNNVLSFPSPNVVTVPKQFEREIKKKIPIKEFYTLKCRCGKNRLNLMNARLCRRNELGQPKYDPATDTFECPECNATEETKNASN